MKIRIYVNVSRRIIYECKVNSLKEAEKLFNDNKLSSITLISDGETIDDHYFAVVGENNETK